MINDIEEPAAALAFAAPDSPSEPSLEVSDDDKRRFAPDFDIWGDLQARLDAAFPDRDEEFADMIFHAASRRPRAFK